MTALDQAEIDWVLLHIKGLIFARALLEQRGASESELAEHAAELERERRRLAELARDVRCSGGHPAAGDSRPGATLGELASR